MNCDPTDGIITFNDPPANGPLVPTAYWGSAPYYAVPSGWTAHNTSAGLFASPNVDSEVRYLTGQNPDGSLAVQSMLLDRLSE